jgi:hypothetical protein
LSDPVQARRESDYDAAEDALHAAEVEGMPAAVAELVACALTNAPVEPYGGPTLGDRRALALLRLAASLGRADGADALARAASCADDGRVLAAIAYRAVPPLQPKVVAQAGAALRAIERDYPGAVVYLVTLAGFGDEAALLAEAAAAGRQSPKVLGDLARGEMCALWPLVAMPAPATTAQALWKLTRDWEAWPRLELRVRLAPCLPSKDRSAAIRAAFEDLRRTVDGQGARQGCANALTVLAPHLAVAEVDVATAMLPRLDSVAAAQAVALRQLELGGSVEQALALIEGFRESCQSHGYWRAVTRALGLTKDQVLAEALAGHLEARDDSRGALFIEAHAEAFARGLDTERLLAMVAAMTPERRVLSLGALAPHLPARRDELLAEALTIAESLDPYEANLHVFVGSARWLPEPAAKWVLARLVSLPPYRGGLLIGDDGDPHELPGLVQLVPLLRRLGGTATLSATAQVVASL